MHGVLQLEMQNRMLRQFRVIWIVLGDQNRSQRTRRFMTFLARHYRPLF
jgi:hypothetical protein